MDNKKKILLLAVISFFIIIATVSVTYAFFNYTREGVVNVLQMGNIEFAMLDGDNVLITNAFPESDAEGNLNEAYEFTVKNTSSEGFDINYNLIFLDNNKEDNTNYFRNDQIKYSLVKNGSYVADTSSTTGNKMSSINGFYLNVSNGEGYVLKNQLIKAGETDAYSLRIWISDDVDYSNDTGVGTYNDYKYSLRVKVGTSEKVSAVHFADKILLDNPDVKDNPILNDVTSTTGEVGLYVTNDTNSGNPSYYYRGAVENNYVSFAGLNWRIIRVDEDNSVKMILDSAIYSGSEYRFSSNNRYVSNIYYSNSNAKSTVSGWYNSNIGNVPDYDKYVITANFCEQAKVKPLDGWTVNNADVPAVANYTPNFTCQTDGNGYGIYKSKAALITFDELVFAGAYYKKDNASYYLASYEYLWTMSPAGYGGYNYSIWYIAYGRKLNFYSPYEKSAYRPVISLNANTLVTGDGTIDNKYVIAGLDS